ncbi:hypothetical protein cypCar_00037162 [Cyprinus carpio]|nr:hypothetical protein cypCar_00037162 [Cyprinus carpio]
MFPTALPTRKRRRPEVAFVGGREEVKFRDVTLFLVERRMGKSRRNFLSNLARSKGFCVDDALSADVTHVVSEGNAAQELWSWLEEQGFRETRDKHVLHISWFTESMSAGRPVPVEIRHYIQWDTDDASLAGLMTVNLSSSFSCFSAADQKMACLLLAGID